MFDVMRMQPISDCEFWRKRKVRVSTASTRIEEEGADYLVSALH